MRSVVVALLVIIGSLTVLTACSGSSGSRDAGECASLVGQKVAEPSEAQVEAACKNIVFSNGAFPCKVNGKAAGQIAYVKTGKGNYAGRSGQPWRTASKAQAQHLGVLAKLVGCDVS